MLIGKEWVSILFSSAHDFSHAGSRRYMKGTTGPTLVYDNNSVSIHHLFCLLVLNFLHCFFLAL